MAYLAQCAPERIPMSLVEGAIDQEDERLQALATLSEVSLTKEHPFADNSPAITVHRLIQAVARAKWEAIGIAQDPANRLLACLSTIYPDDGLLNPLSWPACDKLTPHALVQQSNPLSTESLLRLAELLERVGDYFVGRVVHEHSPRAVLTRIAINLERDPKLTGAANVEREIADQLNNVAVLLEKREDLAASQLAHTVLEVRKIMLTLGSKNPIEMPRLSKVECAVQTLSELLRVQAIRRRVLTARLKFGRLSPGLMLKLVN